MSNETPEALRLADALQEGAYLLSVGRDVIAAELRRQHAEIEALRADAERYRAWIEEAVSYVGGAKWSPSLEEEGKQLLTQR